MLGTAPEGIIGSLLGSKKFIPAQGWGAANKLSGAYPFSSGYTSSIAAYQTWLGAAVDFVSVYANGPDWPTIQTNVNSQITALASANKPLQWSIGLPATGVTLAQVASGVHDSQFVTMANAFLAARPSDPTIVLRPFWEFQLTSFAWTSVGHEADYIAAFRRVVQLFLGVSTKFRIVWCPNQNTIIATVPYDPSQVYPGDAYVDVIGMDSYYIVSFDSSDPVAAWRFKVGATYGLNWLALFGAAHGKPIALGEWGINTDVAASFVSATLEWLQSHNVAYHAYFNTDAGGNFNNRLDLNQYPTAGARYIQEFKAPIKTNLFTSPNDFTNAAWFKNNVTITPGQLDPLGGATAAIMLETVANANHNIEQDLTKASTTASFTGVTSGTTLTASAVTGTINASDWLNGAGITAGTVQIAYQLTGTPGGAGTYKLSTTSNIASEAMTTTQTYRYYIWAKPQNGRQWCDIQISESAFVASCVSYVDVLNGAQGSNFFSFGGMAIAGGFYYPDNNGFYKIGFEAGTFPGTALEPLILSASADGTNSFAGDVTKGLVIYTAWLRQIM